MVLLSKVRPKTYQDSIRLMQISDTLSNLDRVSQSIVAMGTDANKRVLAEINLLTEEVRAANSNDLMIVIEAESQDAAEEALTEADMLLAKGQQVAQAGEQHISLRTLAAARAHLEGINLAVISVAGQYAPLEAAKALQAGMHVFLFSDNVSLNDELVLKQLATSKGLLMMGPGCGTAIINGVALAFANVVERGAVGIAAASGTGLQELTSLITRGGVGISQAIGVGGRDLSENIGGLMMRQALTMLASDPQTELIVVLSKPPHPAVRDSVLDMAQSSGKPVIVNFLGDQITGKQDNLVFTGSIEDTARAVLNELGGNVHPLGNTGPSAFAQIASAERARLAPDQKYLRGLFSGGSLCDESMEILNATLPGVYSNIPLNEDYRLASGFESRANTCVDMGEEEFTEGRPHPMIDLRLRQERIMKEAADPEVAVILLDVVIGYGAHDNPGGELAGTIKKAKQVASDQGRYLTVIAHVCGTEGDPQGLSRQESLLREAGVIVMPTNAQAAHLAAHVAQGLDESLR